MQGSNMRNKKGILLPETLKILIAVACIVLLLYLLISMYGLFTKKTRLEQGRATLDEITTKIDALNEGQTATVLMQSPKDWALMLFEIGKDSPNACLGQNCICICEGSTVEDCNSFGICRRTDRKVNLDGNIENFIIILPPKSISITKSQDAITIKG